MERLKRRLLDLAILFILWVLLAWSKDWQDYAAGGVVAILMAFFLSGLLPERAERLFSPVRWFWALAHLAWLSFWIIVANFDVLYRVLHPNMPIRPGIVKIRTSLRSDEAKTFLANSITLTPGTFTVDIIDDHLYIHCINVQGDPENVQEQTHNISAKFEPTLRRVFD